MNLAHVEHLLPEVVQAIVEIIGLPATMTLVNKLGGTTFPVALRKSRAGEIRFELLAEVVGVPAAEALTKHFGGESLYIPQCKVALRELQYRAIRSEFDALTEAHSALHAVAVLATRYRLSDRQVWRVLKRSDDIGTRAPAQDCLF